MNKICLTTPEHFFIEGAYESGAVSVQAAFLLLTLCLLVEGSCQAARTTAGFTPALFGLQEGACRKGGLYPSITLFFVMHQKRHLQVRKAWALIFLKPIYIILFSCFCGKQSAATALTVKREFPLWTGPRPSLPMCHQFITMPLTYVLD